MIRPHLQEAADGHSQPDSASVTQEDVQNHLVPPALREVGQQMHEEKLFSTDKTGVTGEQTMSVKSPSNIEQLTGDQI